MNKVIVGSIIRHVLTVVATLLAAKGISIDAGTVTSITDLIVGLMLGGGVMVQSYVEKTKSDKVLKENPIIEPEPVVVHKGYFLGDKSMKNLKGVHPDLVRVISRAIVNSPYDFSVNEGLRSVARQTELFNAKPKVTQTMKSKHLKQSDGYGHAVDLYVFDASQPKGYDERISTYKTINDHIQSIAEEEGVNIRWGGTFTDSRGRPWVDGFHWEIEP